MTSGYTPLFSSIVNSTIWREDNETRIVWITILALKDQNGFVDAALPGLADAARVSIEDCEKALTTLMSPDPYSRTKDFEGRRVEEVPGGWKVLNHEAYEERARSRAGYYKERRARIKAEQQAQQLRNTAQQERTLSHKGATPITVPVTVPSTSDSSTSPSPPKKSGRVKGAPTKFNAAKVKLPSNLPEEQFRPVWKKWVKFRREKHAVVTETMAESQLKKMSKIGIERSISMIEFTIFKGWQGLREPSSKELTEWCGDTPSQYPTIDEFPIDENMVELIQEKVERRQVDMKKVLTYMKEKWGKDKLTELSMVQGEALLELVKKAKRK